MKQEAAPLNLDGSASRDFLMKSFQNLIAALRSISEESRRAERSVPMKQNSVHRYPPTFLGIGSMRCGSTWLYEVLKCHSDIRMSDRKEMDFFFLHGMLQ